MASDPSAAPPVSPLPAAPSPLATPEPWNLVAAGYTALALPYFERFSREALRLAERVRATVGDGPLVIGRGAFLGVGVA